MKYAVTFDKNLVNYLNRNGVYVEIQRPAEKNRYKVESFYCLVDKWIFEIVQNRAKFVGYAGMELGELIARMKPERP